MLASFRLDKYDKNEAVVGDLVLDHSNPYGIKHIIGHWNSMMYLTGTGRPLCY
jgi:hypothetical protein